MQLVMRLPAPCSPVLLINATEFPERGVISALTATTQISRFQLSCWVSGATTRTPGTALWALGVISQLSPSSHCLVPASHSPGPSATFVWRSGAARMAPEVSGWSSGPTSPVSCHYRCCHRHLPPAAPFPQRQGGCHNPCVRSHPAQGPVLRAPTRPGDPQRWRVGGQLVTEAKTQPRLQQWEVKW